ncbi:MAG: ribosome biogenesis GTPase Der, partial [Blastocatellia bacterium]
AELARRTNRPVFVAANKVDAARLEADALEFGLWGFEVYPISAEHGGGVGELLDAALEVLPDVRIEEEAEPERPIRVAIIGRPNVGKSSLVNKLMGADRVIVSPIPGTTRDAVDTDLLHEGVRFRLIDTAGIRRKGKTELMAEKISVVMARRHLERADIAILLIDGIEGPTALDATIAGYAHEAGTGLIIAVNKWDAVERDEDTAKRYETRIREMMKFADYAEVVFISAKTGHRVDRLLKLAAEINTERNKRVQTSELNRFFERSLARSTASVPERSQSRVLYITQISTRPPTFVLFTTSRDARSKLHFSYERYIINRLREEFSFKGTPIRVIQRGKPKRGA